MRTTTAPAFARAMLALVAAAGCASPGGARPEAAAELPLAVIDAHLHTNFSDWPLVRIEPYLRAFARAIPREHWQAVFHDNAARVYGFR